MTQTFSVSTRIFSMLEQQSGFPRARTLLHETPDPPSISGVSARAGEPDVFSGGLAAAIERLVHLDSIDVVTRVDTPARGGARAAWPTWVDPRIVGAWAVRGVEQPWAHQTRALDVNAAGRDLVLATATASGKSLCYQTPIVQHVLEDAASTALLLFPTKALARDQVEGLRALTGAQTPVRGAVGIAVYDGDTPPDRRRAARARAHVVATNPDMLHRGILPNHDGWARFFSGLRTIVLDELHTYRGLFGSHVAHVLRRLLRLCRHYGSTPRIIACSATISQPGDLARRLTAREDIEVIDEDTSAAGPRTTLVLNPRVVDATTGVRRSALAVARRVCGELDQDGISTLAFCRTRKQVELLTRYLRERAAKVPPARAGTPAALRALPREPAGGRLREVASASIRSYRGGYLPEHRREIERALRSGEARLVASTNALELGMDIGGIDAVVMVGYPGTRAATWQRAGRAGRRGRASLAVVVLDSTPLDQYVASVPGFLFGAPVERARIDPDNPEVAIPHLRCAAHELGFAGEGSTREYPGLGREELEAVLEHLAAHGSLHAERSEEGRTEYFSAGVSFPADGVDLRGSLEENFTVIELSEREGESPPEGGRILAQVDYEDAPFYLHPGAIYPLEGRTYLVRRLDWDGREAFVREVESSYYTEAIARLRVRIVNEHPETDALDGHGTGYAHVIRSVPGFKKLRFWTHENVGFGPVELPELELHTVAAHWRLPERWAAGVAGPMRRAAAAYGVAHALHHAAVSLLMCDTADVGRALAAGDASGWAIGTTGRHAPKDEATRIASGRVSVVLWDKVPGGAGLSKAAYELGAALFDRALASVSGCGCEHGCPTCVGTEANAVAGPAATEEFVEVEAPIDAPSPAQLRPDVAAALRLLREDVTQEKATT